MLRKEQIQFIQLDGFACLVSNDCGVSVSHHFEGHVHEAHGHKSASSSGHGEEREEEERKAERKGISFICSGRNFLRKLAS